MIASHDGKCFRNSSPHGPATSETFSATEAARLLLIDEAGNLRSDETMCFADEIGADNDTSGPSNFIREQNRIIGSAADGLADHAPDGSHVMKNLSNACYSIRTKDPSFNGVGMLENLRIKAIVTDARNALREYKCCKGGIGNNPQAKRKCLEVIGANIRHHCGDHSFCKHAGVCNFLKLRQDNPTWDETQV